MQAAYFGKKKLKKKIVKRAKAHRDMGTITRASFGHWEIISPGTAEFRGCAVGCLTQPLKKSVILDGFTTDAELDQYVRENYPEVDSEFGGASDLKKVEDTDPYQGLLEKFNFSKELSGLIDAIFEQIDPEDAKDWPLRIVKAIPVGCDVSGQAIRDLVINSRPLQEVIAGRFSAGCSEAHHIHAIAEFADYGGMNCDEDTASIAADDLVGQFEMMPTIRSLVTA